MTYKKKLIEVALPLEAINAASAYEKMPGIGPHPRGIHLWWARRPLAAARAVIWSSLVDDPSSLPEQFPTEEAQAAERERLFGILSELVKWENSNNQEILNAAKAEIMKSTNGNPPALLDPFAGGGAIPLEAQRLGLEAHASDLNPVAVMINKAMIEIPPKFANQPPVNPDAKKTSLTWEGAQGLAEDVRYYGEWMKKKAFERIGHLYPKVKDEYGQEHTVIAWIWARTIKCPNPACGCQMPLVNNFTVAKKKRKIVYIQPIISGNNVTYTITNGKPKIEGTIINRNGAKCICCDTFVDFAHIREEAANGRMERQLLAIAAEGRGGKEYYSPLIDHIEAASVFRPDEYPESQLPKKALGINIKAYGFNEHTDLFTNRQLTAIATFSSLVTEAREKIMNDGGTENYAQAVSVYLAFAVDRCADFSNAVTRWVPSNEKIMNLFGRQTIAMTWDYPEANVFADSVGGFVPVVNYISQCILKLPMNVSAGEVIQADAQTRMPEKQIIVSTDPPYYDNIGYADLSDFFYIWLRQSLRSIYPDVFRTVLVPKVEELIANPYRFEEGVREARVFFENGMLRTFKQIFKYATDEAPVSVYYAFKQSDEDANNNIASTGWETMLSAIITAGFTISGTWPMRTEQITRNRSLGSNALASSIVLVCRKRPSEAPTTTRRDFINTLKRELKPALQNLQASNIAPVDMAQAAIGPGMGVYSRYAQVLEADGTPMSVRTALQLINHELDVFFNEQDGELDRESRFCVELYSQAAFNQIKFGEADVLARAKNTSVDALAQGGLLLAEKGSVRLLTREELPSLSWTKLRATWMVTQQLTKAMESGGNQATAAIISTLPAGSVERAKALAYRLFSIAERKGWAKEAFAYNALVNSWKDVQASAAEISAAAHDPKQGILFDD